MSAAPVDVLVVGAGAAGLAAARTLHAAGREVLVVEAADRPGGVVRTREVDGYRVECGPNTLRVSAPALALLRACGLEARLRAASPASRRRCLVRGGRPVPLPLGPLALARTPLLSVRGKLRLLGEPFVRGGDPTEESAAGFARRRLGSEAARALVEPFLVGIYAGDAEELGADAVFPSLAALERRHGSIARGLAVQALARLLAGGAGSPRGLAGSFSTDAGLGPLAGDLAAGLGDALRLRTRALALARDGAGWRAELAGPDGEQKIGARAVLVATPAAEAAALLGALDPALGTALAAFAYAPIAAVAFGADPAGAREPIEGFGFLVPRGEDPDLLGCLFMSRLFPGRAPAGRELLHCMLGGRRRPELLDLPDDRLVERARESLIRILGLRGEVRAVSVVRWPRAVPQPGRDQLRRAAAVRALAADAGPLRLAGAYLDGVSLADTLASGAAAAAALPV
jgi:oxygen-dependent protoporphyrinogen oxidase